MGQHRAVESTTQRTSAVGRAAGAASHVGRIGALAVALGIGAAMAGGTAIAGADDPSGKDSGSTSDGTGSAAGDSPAGDKKDAATASSPAGDPDRKKPGKPKLRLPRSLQESSGAAYSSTRGRGWTRAAAEIAAGADEGATPIATPADPVEQTRDSARAKRLHRADTGDRSVRSVDTDAVTTRVRAPASDIADAARRFTAAAADTPSIDTAAVVVRADAAALTRRTAASITAPIAPTARLTAAPAPRPAVSNLLAAVGLTALSLAGTGDIPAAPNPVLLSVLQLTRRETETALLRNTSSVAPNTVAPRGLVTNAAGTTAVTPRPGDTAETPYGHIGKWMLKSDGSIANWGGQSSGGQPLREPVNVIVIDRTSSTPEESARKLNRALLVAGYPASAPHSTGFSGIINGTTYGQQPAGFLVAYSNNESPNSHGRMFGPAPATDGLGGYVWSGAFSTQRADHGYLSFNSARDDLAESLVTSGAATQLDDEDMENAGITGDHDGDAVVLELTDAWPNTAPRVKTVSQNRPVASTGKVTGKVTAVDNERDRMTYAGSGTTAKGTVTVAPGGSFTYTPTAAARHAAAARNAPPEAKTDTFTVTVTDEYGGVTTRQVTVPVAPKNTAPSSVRATAGKPHPVSGTVTGRVAVTDADGDTVAYRATDPARGDVTVNPDGSFVYTPTPEARERARVTRGTDTDRFTVTVDDGYGGVKTVTVTTTIAPRNAAPVAALGAVGGPAANGAVRGSVTASDPDTDTYAFSAPSRTTFGTVSVSKTTGAFTYTPTAAGRRAAAANPGLQDIVFITVTDTYGATSTVAVPVTVLPTATI